MTLQVIKAEDVRDGESRWYCRDGVEAADAIMHNAVALFVPRSAEEMPFRFAIVDRPAPTAPPALDLDAVERAERAMTPGEWRADFTYVTAAGGPVATCIGPDAEHDAAGIVALRNAAPALIAEVRALRRHYDAAGPDHNLLALLDLYHEREQAALAKLAEAKRLGLIAARVVLDDDTDLPAIAAALEAL